jgi:hypothetical protein
MRPLQNYLPNIIREAQNVVVETILLILHTIRTRLIHGVGDPNEMVSELDGHVFVKFVVGRQLHRYLKHVLGEQ